MTPPRNSKMNCNELQQNHKPSRYLVKRPKALQWFHHDRLCKDSDEERQAGRFELFLDLLYVAILASLADTLAEEPGWAQAAKFLLNFCYIRQIHSDLRELMNSFYQDDLPQRALVLWLMALLILYANSANLVDEDPAALRVAAGAYVVARLTTLAAFLVASFASYQHRTQARILAGFMFVGLLLMLPLFLDRLSLGAKAAVAAVVVVYQEATWAITLSPWIKRRLKLTYSTAVDIAHEVDRMAAFFIIILGEFVYSIVVGNPTGIGLTSGYGKAVCTLVIAFTLNWIYASGDGSVQATHPIRRSAWAAFGFFLLHLPLSSSFLIGGHIAAMSVGVEYFEDGHRWLLGGGLGVGMLCLWFYALLYRTEGEHTLLLTKTLRIGPRLLVAIILLILPKTHNHLNAADFLGIITGLFGFLLIWETVAGLSRDAHIFEPWDGRHPPPEDGEEEHLVDECYLE
ncbi:hypothetical protein HJFPF1_12870 [Paramyrothecium foliicola]|nr:hypothetical protein HJFPF1_12870 [Paramyrothecium foliicola]